MKLNIRVKIKKLAPKINFVIPAALGACLMWPLNRDSSTSIQSKSAPSDSISGDVFGNQLLRVNEKIERDDKWDYTTQDIDLDQFKSKKFRNAFRKLNRRKRLEAEKQLTRLCKQKQDQEMSQDLKKDLQTYCKHIEDGNPKV